MDSSSLGKTPRGRTDRGEPTIHHNRKQHFAIHYLMPEYRRNFVAGGTYFFTVVTYHRLPILTNPYALKILHNVWEDNKKHRPLETIAVCLLPEDLHCIWKLPEGDSDYSTR